MRGQLARNPTQRTGLIPWTKLVQCVKKNDEGALCSCKFNSILKECDQFIEFRRRWGCLSIPLSNLIAEALQETEPVGSVRRRADKSADGLNVVRKVRSQELRICRIQRARAAALALRPPFSNTGESPRLRPDDQ